MNMFTPAEVTRNYGPIGRSKSDQPTLRMFMLAILAGFFVAFGAFGATIANHGTDNGSTARLLSGLVFPIGIAMVMVTGAELFTGNTLIVISVLNRENTIARMLRNWFWVYTGNFVGSVILATANVYSGQLDYSTMAVQTIAIAAGKSSLEFGPALVLAFFCNVLVTVGVFCSLAAKDVAGRMIGAFLPIAIFVVAGFEHSVANMYFLPAGLMAMRVPEYAEAARAAGIDTGMLTVSNSIFRNLIPVTLGNILGGVSVGALMWYAFLKPDTVKLHMKDEPAES